MNVFQETTLGISNGIILALPIYVLVLLVVGYIGSFLYLWLWAWIDDETKEGWTPPQNPIVRFTARLWGYATAEDLGGNKIHSHTGTKWEYVKKSKFTSDDYRLLGSTVMFNDRVSYDSGAFSDGDGPFFKTILASALLTISIVWWNFFMFLYVGWAIAITARFVRRLQKKLTAHITDPEAHKNT